MKAYYLAYKHKKPEGGHKEGRAIHQQGYILIRAWDHPFCTREGYVMEHRLVWETYHRATLLPWADVHHLNGIKTDNQPNNLEAMMRGQHTTLHFTDLDMNTRLCSICKSKTYHRNNGRDEWYLDPTDKAKYHCRKCYRKMVYKQR